MDYGEAKAESHVRSGGTTGTGKCEMGCEGLRLGVDHEEGAMGYTSTDTLYSGKSYTGALLGSLTTLASRVISVTVLTTACLFSNCQINSFVVFLELMQR